MMMTFLSVVTFATALSAIVLMTYAHLRIFNRPYFGKEHSAQPDKITSLQPALTFVRHLEVRHWWEQWLGSFLVRFFSKETPELRERKTFAHLYLPSNPTKPCPLVIYTHGNGATIEEAAAWLEQIVDRGYALLMPEFRGFGEAGAHPHRELICRDLCFFYDEAMKTGLLDPNNITFYGRSLGGGITCDLAERRSAHRLILESTYYKLREIVGSKHIPDYVMVGKDFECAKTVATFAGAILICHGEHDSVSPVAQALKLKALNPRVELKLFNANHGDIYQKTEYQEHVLSWLNQRVEQPKGS